MSNPSANRHGSGPWILHLVHGIAAFRAVRCCEHLTDNSQTAGTGSSKTTQTLPLTLLTSRSKYPSENPRSKTLAVCHPVCKQAKLMRPSKGAMLTLLMRQIRAGPFGSHRSEVRAQQICGLWIIKKKKKIHPLVTKIGKCLHRATPCKQRLRSLQK